MLFSLPPALGASKLNLNESLKETGLRSSSRFGGRRAHGVLVVAEIALSLVPLIGAGLMMYGIWGVLHTDLGFDAEHLAAMEINLPMSQYMDAAGVAAGVPMLKPKPRAILLRHRIQEELRALPGVKSASVTINPPLSGCVPRFAGVGSQQPPAPGSRAPVVCLYPVSSEYFQTLDVPLKKGRGFTEQDNETSPPVAVISESMARRYFPNEDPMGKLVNLGRPQLGGDKEPPLQVVGVVSDLKQGLAQQQPIPAVYMPYSQLTVPFQLFHLLERNTISYVVRTGGDPAGLVQAIRRVASNAAKDAVVLDVYTIDDIKTGFLRRMRFYSWLLTVFAGIAVTLALVGVFGVMSYAVSRRTQEIGIQMALGARPMNVLRLVMKQGLLMVLFGIALGLAGAFGLTRFLASLLFQVKPTDPMIFTVISILLCVVALIACFIPARRAAKLDPNRSLRYE